MASGLSFLKAWSVRARRRPRRTCRRWSACGSCFRGWWRAPTTRFLPPCASPLITWSCWQFQCRCADSTFGLAMLQCHATVSTEGEPHVANGTEGRCFCASGVARSSGPDLPDVTAQPGAADHHPGHHAAPLVRHHYDPPTSQLTCTSDDSDDMASVVLSWALSRHLCDVWKMMEHLSGSVHDTLHCVVCTLHTHSITVTHRTHLYTVSSCVHSGKTCGSSLVGRPVPACDGSAPLHS